ncbi:hypothetical protein ACFX2I_013571 [Malus domestica]
MNSNSSSSSCSSPERFFNMSSRSKIPKWVDEYRSNRVSYKTWQVERYGGGVLYTATTKEEDNGGAA